MHPPTGNAQTDFSRTKLAGLCCLCLGVGMVLWTAAWLIIERVIAHELPDPGRLAGAGLSALSGTLFVLLFLLIRRRVRWALRVAFVVCSLLAAATAVSLVQGARGFAPIFTLLLSGAAAASAFSVIADRSVSSSRV